ncbi:hypothetical protein [Rathayibacter sp. VKM Ac-2630]|uniref:hypothetical protein n=1 Tax=Rathayibacter sp. VKM Ac-2630 TaxID=1938617 RepID=UPI000980B00D|nr:hypothetical protein [Rathayibacter sp. VKM Ac-2630]OOB90905.1 hypothetical protein B0T42_09190 [Rathayibacter sp. VKM Ac-2630]
MTVLAPEHPCGLARALDSEDPRCTVMLLRDALRSPGAIHPGLAAHLLEQLGAVDCGRNDCRPDPDSSSDAW